MQITDPDKFEIATIVTKNSKTGITSNKRLLVIKKGYLYYYSKVPKTFKGDPKVLQSYHELPKCSIEILNIKKINGYQNNSSYFSIQFQSKHMMQRQDIRKTMTLQEFNFAPKNTKQIITWQFTCDNQFAKQRWVAALNALHSHYSKQKINIQRFFENITKKQQEPVALPVRSSTRVPWKEDQIKKSGSNQNLLNRTSYVNTMILNNRASQQKKNIRSDSNSQSNKTSENKSLEKKRKDVDNIVQNFIREEQQKQVNEDKPFQNSFFEKSFTNKTSEAGQLSSRDQKIKQLSDSKEQFEAKEQIIAMKSNEDLFIKKTDSFIATPPLLKERKISDFEAVTVDKPAGEYKQQIPEKPQQLEQSANFIEQQSKISKNITPLPLPPSKPSPPYQIKQQKIMKHQSHTIIKTVPPISSKTSLNSHRSFYDLQLLSFHRQYSFHKRFEGQKKLNNMVGNFIQKAEEGFIDYINSKSSSQSSRYKEIKINDKLLQIQMGYLNYTVGLVSTQGLMINGKKRIYYDEESVKSLKKIIKIYKLLFSQILKAHKNIEDQTKINQIFQKLKVPLCVYIQYKGVSCLAYQDNTHQYAQNIINNKLLQKDLHECFKEKGLNSDCFVFKQCNTEISSYYIPYISTTKGIMIGQKLKKKNHNITFENPLNIDFLKNAKRQDASTSTESLLKYIKGIRSIKDSAKFSCPRDQILRVLQYSYFCKFFRKFYRAAQGQINQKTFLNLLFKGDQNITKLFETAGFESEFISKISGKKLFGIFFQFLQYYLGISCYFNTSNIRLISMIPLKIISKDKISIIKEIKLKSRTFGYDLQQLELYQSFAKLEKFMLNKDGELLAKALELKETVYFQNPYQQRNYPWPANLECQKNSAQINFIENDYISCINKCKIFLESFDMTRSQEQTSSQIISSRIIPHIAIPIYLLMLKCYSKFSLQKFNTVLKETTQAIILNYGQQSTLMATLCSFVGSTYQSMGFLDKGRQFLNASIKIGQKIYNNQKLSEMFLDYSRVLKNSGNIQQSLKYLEKAKQVIAQQISESFLFKILSYDLQLLLFHPKTVQNQQKIFKLISKIQQTIHFDRIETSQLRDLFKIYFQIGNKFQISDIIIKSINSLWSMVLDSCSQSLAIQLAYGHILYKNKERLEGVHNESQKIKSQYPMSKQKALMILSQKQKENYHSIIEMIDEAMIQEDFPTLGAIFSLISVKNGL